MRNQFRKRGFTLIELLVVIAIIAILAAILFPVFAQAKAAAKKTAALTHAKQVGTATHIYMADYDDIMPIAIRSLTSGNYTSLGVEVPEDLRTDPTAGAAQAATVNTYAVFWANSLHPYTKNRDIMSAELPETPTVSAPFLTAPANVGLTMNGLLNTYPHTAIDRVAEVPMFWYGLGNQQLVGYARSQPVLNCSGQPVTAGCLFQPGQHPAGGASANGDARYGYAGISAAPFTGGNIFVRTDSSAKFQRYAGPGVTNQLNVSDPHMTYNDDFVATRNPRCRRPGESVSYWCHFRPDWDQTFDNWEVL